MALQAAVDGEPHKVQSHKVQTHSPVSKQHGSGRLSIGDASHSRSASARDAAQLAQLDGAANDGAPQSVTQRYAALLAQPGSGSLAAAEQWRTAF